MTTLQTVTAGIGADTRVNENFAQTSPSALYARDPVTSTGLTWGYKGGQFATATIADGTLTLTASVTNYVVASRSTGAVSVATATTNWNDTANYLRLYSVVAGASTVTSYSDQRQLIGMAPPVNDFANAPGTTTGLTYGYYAGQVRQDNVVTAVGAGTLALTASATNYVEVSGAGAVSANTVGFTSGRFPMATVVTGVSTITTITDKRGIVSLGQGAQLGGLNAYTANQSVTPVALISGASIAVNAALSNNFKLVLGINATLANPTGLTDGMVLNVRIKQDAAGGRTLACGTKYKFPGGVAPTLSTAANAVDFMSCYYDSADDTLVCNFTKAYG